MSGGSVYQLIRGGKKVRRKDGSYIWCVDYQDGKGRRVTKSTFRSKRDAETFLENTNVDVRSGKHTPDRDSITINAACDLWLADCQPHVERSTYVKYEQHCRLYIKPRIGEWKLSQFTRPDVLNFLSDLGKDVSDAMAKKVLASLKAVINAAMDKGKVAQNVALGVGKKSHRQRRTEAVQRRLKAGRDFPTDLEVNAMLKLANQPPAPDGKAKPYPWNKNGNAVLLAVIAETGARISELRGLAWSFVDTERRTITIEQRADEWGEIGPPKSAAGARTIQISEALADELAAWKARQAEASKLKLRRNGEVVELLPVKLVFPNGNGKPESVQNLYARFLHPLQVAAKITDPSDEEGGAPVPRYGWHAFRHYRASKLIHEGKSVVEVAAFLGHSDPTMTLRVYAHEFKGHEGERLQNAAPVSENPQKTIMKAA